MFEGDRLSLISTGFKALFKNTVIRRQSAALFFLCCVFSLVFSACFPSSNPSKKTKKPLLINGAGASFPYILYSKWFSEYRKIDSSVIINYRSVGSGGGIRQFLAGTTDFGATDVPIKPEALKKHKKKVLHIPSTLGAVALSYHLPELSKDKKSLRLNAQVLVDIYRGKIKKWNHEELKKLNPALSLPDRNILPVYRSDGSGTTAIFTEYLAHFSPEWLEAVGKGKAVRWPQGIGGKGNEGVMGFLQKTPGAIGYVGMSYAVNRKWPMAEIQNSTGHFVRASVDSVRKAAEQTLSQTKDLFHPMVQVGGENVYPLSSYTYLLFYQQMSGHKGRVLLKMLHWILGDAQKFSEKLYYIPLPDPVIKQIQATVDSIQVVPSD